MGDFAKAFAGYEETAYGWASETTDNPVVPATYTVQVHDDFGAETVVVDIDGKQDVVTLDDGRIYVEPTQSTAITKLFNRACTDDSITIRNIEMRCTTDSDTGEHQVTMFCYFVKDGKVNYCHNFMALSDGIVPARLHRNDYYNGTKWGMLVTDLQIIGNTLKDLMANPKSFCTEEQLSSREVQRYRM